MTYRGYYYDQDLNLYYLQSRYYDPTIGRFINADAVGFLGANGDLNSYNLYAYCSNNPVMYTDPSGHSITLLIIGIVTSMLVSGLVSGTVSAATAELSGEDSTSAFWGGFTAGSLSALAIGVGMAVTGPLGIALTTGLGFCAGVAGDTIKQGVDNGKWVGFDQYDIGSALFSGTTNALNCLVNVGSMNLYMSDSFSPALSGMTSGSRFIEFMTFDASTMFASIYFGTIYGMFDSAISMVKDLI